MSATFTMTPEMIHTAAIATRVTARKTPEETPEIIPTAAIATRVPVRKTPEETLECDEFATEP